MPFLPPNTNQEYHSGAECPILPPKNCQLGTDEQSRSGQLAQCSSFHYCSLAGNRFRIKVLQTSSLFTPGVLVVHSHHIRSPRSPPTSCNSVSSTDGPGVASGLCSDGHPSHFARLSRPILPTALCKAHCAGHRIAGEIIHSIPTESDISFHFWPAPLTINCITVICHPA